MKGRKRATRIAILGAGAGGIAMGVELKAAGFETFQIFEKADGVGGVWRHNTYPGAGCDVMSHLYSFSFEPKADWSRMYALQPEILEYLEHCTDEHGLRPHLRLSTAVVEARWNDREAVWSLRTDGGDEHTVDVLISAVGMLDIPKVPDLAGRERFEGTAFHSARWDHGETIQGKRVAVIGTGPSAVQFVPAIAPDAAHLTLFQRSPGWLVPKIDRAYSDEEKRRFARVPLAARRHRWEIFWNMERNAAFGVDDPPVAAQAQLALSYLERKVADPGLRQALTPDYPFGCKRPLISRDYYPALQRDNVRLVTEPIEQLTATGVRTADGVEHEVDTIVYGTGFEATNYLTGIEVFGRGGRRLHDDWREGAEAYLGMTVAGYPSFFMLYGPNTNGAMSILFMLEVQADYIARAIRSIVRHGSVPLVVRDDVMRRYNDDIQAQMAGKVWAGSCQNYFRTAAGKITTQLPFRSTRYWRLTRRFRRRDYLRVPRTD